MHFCLFFSNHRPGWLDSIYCNQGFHLGIGGVSWDLPNGARENWILKPFHDKATVDLMGKLWPERFLGKLAMNREICCRVVDFISDCIA